MDVWPFMPQAGPVEALEWLTDVIRCRSTEQRLCMRPFPRQEFALSHRLRGDAIGRARERAKAIGYRECWLPVWEEMAELGAVSPGVSELPVDSTHTSYREDGSLLIWQDDLNYEVRPILEFGSGTIVLESVTVGTYGSALAVPLRAARFAQDFETSLAPGEDVAASARFVGTLTEDLSGEAGTSYPTYLGLPVVTDPAVLTSGAVRETCAQSDVALDSGTGLVERLPSASSARRSSVASWSTHSPGELWNLRVWLHKRKGQWRAFWAPSWTPDLELTTQILATDTEIEVAALDYGAHYPSPADFLLRTTAGDHYGFRVTSHRAGSTGHEILTLTAAASFAVTIEDVDIITRMVPSRFAADRIEIQHHVAGQARIAVPIVEVPA